MNKNSKPVRKRFKCVKCKGFESQIVNSIKLNIKCSNCGGLLTEISEKEYKSKNDNKNKKGIEEKKKNIPTKTNKNNFSNYSNDNKLSSDIKTINYKGIKISQNDINKNNLRKKKIELEKEKELKKLKEIEEEKKLKERIEREKERQRQRFKSSNHYSESENDPNSDVYNRSNNNSLRENSVNDENRNIILGSLFRGIFNLMGGSQISNQPQILSIQSTDNNPVIIRVIRQDVSEDIFDQSFLNFGSNFNDNFRDNYSSNFRSNLGNFFTQLIEIVRRNREEAERSKNHPTKKEVLDKLKKFPMSIKYCKKDNKGKFEFPQCSICLIDINKNEETVILPCGHMFHWNCCLIWLKSKNTCPVCRFELLEEKTK